MSKDQNEKSTQFDFAVFEEYVLCFEIPVQYLLVVEVVECETDLYEPVHDLGLREEFALGLQDPVVHVPAFAVHHHDVQVLLFVQERIFVRNDVRVTQFLKQPHLGRGFK